jgi:hypothetical protein
MASVITANSGGLFFTADTSNNIEISSTQVNVTSNLNVTGNVTSNNTITNRTYGSNNNGDPIIIIKNAAVSNALTFNPNEGNNLIHFYGNGTIQASGNVLASNFTSTGNANVGNIGTTGLIATGVSNLGAVGNVIITGGSNGQVLTTNGSGNLSWTTVSGGGGSNIANGNSNVNIPAANGNVNISAVGNANILVVTGTGVNVAGTGDFSGNLTANTITLGNGTGGNISNANVISANTITLGNGTGGNISNANVISANTVNIATTLNVAGVSNLGAVGNVIITGGSNGQVLTTNGSGNLSWTTVSGGSSNISNGTSNVSISTSGGNVTVGVAGNANILTITGTGANITGTLQVTGNTRFGSGSGALQVGNNTRLNTSSNPNTYYTQASDYHVMYQNNFIGFFIGNLGSSGNITAVGPNAGGTSAQGVSIGANAYVDSLDPDTFQRVPAMALGANSYAVAKAIAIGSNARSTSTNHQLQVMLGFNARAGANNTMVFNATGTDLYGNTANSLTVAPVRAVTDVTGFKVMYYNPTTKEVVYYNV